MDLVVVNFILDKMKEIQFRVFLTVLRTSFGEEITERNDENTKWT